MTRTKLLLVGILLWLSRHTFACEVSAPGKILKDSKASISDFQRVLSFKACDQSQIQKTLQFFSDFQGEMNSRLLGSEVDAVSMQKNVVIQDLSDAITKRLNLSSEHYFKEALVIQGQHLLTGSKEAHLEADCSQCQSLGEKTLTIRLSNALEGTSQSHWIRGRVQTKSYALRAKYNLRAHSQGLKPSDFERVEVYTDQPHRLFTQHNQIPFHKLNRGKNKGELLLSTELNPVYLVKVGHPVSIKLNHQGVQLEAKAIASQPGKIGQVIRLKNPKTKKDIIGKVIDFNRVEVEI